ncbi:hypothetical protein RWU53_07155, partial [Enterococcus sp. 3MOLP]|nr:hypothetical protein [Enterococcus sp. 3MOLP]
ASASAVYTCLERGTKVFFTFVPRSFSEQTVFNQLTLGIRSTNGKICGTIFSFVSLILRSKR